VQDVYGFLSLPLISLISKEMKIPPSRIYGVATFYHYFSLKPRGEHNCMVCTGTACYVKGAEKILDQIEKEFGIKPGGATPDNKLSLQAVRCIGACGLAPAVVMDDAIHAKMTPDQIGGVITKAMGVAR
jgi:bidirectional [NiFe] hydrogenase diaphorase subunit